MTFSLCVGCSELSLAIVMDHTEERLIHWRIASLQTFPLREYSDSFQCLRTTILVLEVHCSLFLEPSSVCPFWAVSSCLPLKLFKFSAQSFPKLFWFSFLSRHRCGPPLRLNHVKSAFRQKTHWEEGKRMTSAGSGVCSRISNSPLPLQCVGLFILLSDNTCLHRLHR